MSEAGSSYTISCSDARSVHSRLTSVARTANTCSYTIDPNNSASTGAATFTITYTSTGGHSIDETITVNVGPNSAITYTAPPTTGAGRLLVGRNRALVVDAGSYASETSGSGYTISCGDATSVDAHPARIGYPHRQQLFVHCYAGEFAEFYAASYERYLHCALHFKRRGYG